MNYYDLPEWAGWLASIREQPDDDHRRLFCADWLDELETDEAAWRANYIRRMIADKIGNIEYGGWESGNPSGYDFGLSANPSNRVVLTAHRGFIYRVSAPLAVLHGGECGRCGGAGHGPYDRMNLGWDVCPDCRGTGRTPGVLGEILRREPVTAVGITDIHPDPTSGDMWIWPEEAFDRWPELAEHFGQYAYDSQDEAIKAMSNWLIGYHTEKSRGS